MENTTTTYAEVLAEGYDWDMRLDFVGERVRGFLDKTERPPMTTTDLARTLLEDAGEDMELLEKVIKTLSEMARQNPFLINYGFVTRGTPKKMFGKVQKPYIWKNPRVQYEANTSPSPKSNKRRGQQAAEPLVEIAALMSRVEELEASVKFYQEEQALWGHTMTDRVVALEERPDIRVEKTSVSTDTLSDKVLHNGGMVARETLTLKK